MASPASCQHCHPPNPHIPPALVKYPVKAAQLLLAWHVPTYVYTECLPRTPRNIMKHAHFQRRRCRPRTRPTNNATPWWWRQQRGWHGVEWISRNTIAVWVHALDGVSPVQCSLPRPIPTISFPAKTPRIRRPFANWGLLRIGLMMREFAEGLEVLWTTNVTWDVVLFWT